MQELLKELLNILLFMSDQNIFKAIDMICYQLMLSSAN